MSDRIDNELRRVSHALAEISPPKPDLPRPGVAPKRSIPAWVVAIASFAVVLGAGLIAALVSGSEEQPTSGVISVPEDHTANELLAMEARPNEIPNLATEMGFEFLCGSGGGVQRCVIWEDGVAVIIPFRVREGASLRVRSGPSAEWLEVPFDQGVPVAVGHESGLFIVQQLLDGEHYSSASTYFPSSSSP